jgi:RNA polymerase sigma-B factor
MVRVPRRRRELHLTIRAAIGPMAQRLGHEPSLAELAEEVGCTEPEALDALRAGASYRSLRFEGVDGRTAPAIEACLGTEEPGYEAADRRALLDTLLRALPERERRVVALRFDRDLTQSQIARIVGVSQMQVSRLLQRSLSRMREDAERLMAV